MSDEVKKVLRKYDDKRLRKMATQYGIDPDDYSRAGLIDEITERMSKPIKPEPEPVKAKKSAKKKPKPEPEPPPAPVEPPKSEPKKKGKAKKEKPPEPQPEPVAEARHFTGGKITERTPGVCLFVVEMCRKASREKPVTHRQIIDALVKAFPDRDAAKMANKAKGCKSWMKVHYNMDLSEIRTMDGKGYWLTEEQYNKGMTHVAGRKRGRKGKSDAETTD